MCDIVLILPAYNEARHLSGLIEKIDRVTSGKYALVVIDDGSTDETAKVLAQYPHLHAIHHNKNLGKGAALQSGIQFALSRFNASALLFMDADGQHSPDDIGKLIEAHRRRRGDFIIGRRDFKRGVMPFFRILSNRLTSAMVSLKIGQRVHDSQSGFRLIRSELLLRIGECQSRGYEFETELLLKSAKCGAKIYEVPVTTIYGNQKSHIRPVRDILRFLRVWLKT